MYIDALQRAYYDQLYNAAWNGFTLGYPAYFVRSYVESFHDNAISSMAERHGIYETAARNYAQDIAHISQGAISRRGYEIAYGLDRDLLTSVVPLSSSSSSSSRANNNNNNKRTDDKEQTDDSVEKEWVRHIWESVHVPQ